MLDDFIVRDNAVAQDSEPLSLRNLLGYLLRATEVTGRYAHLGIQLANDEEVFEASTFIPIDTMCLMHKLNLTKEQMRTMRVYMKSKGVTFPSTTSLLSEREKLHPQVKELDDLIPGSEKQG